MRRTYRDIIYIQHFGPHFFKTAKATHENRFWSEVLKAYHEYSLHFQVRSNGEFLASLIMYNGNILINNEVIIRRDFIRNKIFNVNCFMKENSEFLMLREFSSKFNLRLDFLTYHGLIREIGRYKNSLGVLTNSVRTENNPPMHALLTSKSGSSCIYQRILNKPEKPKGIKRWENKLYNIHPWPSFFKHLKKVLTITNYCGCSLESSIISSPQTDLYQSLSQTSANSARFAIQILKRSNMSCGNADMCKHSSTTLPIF